MRVARILHLAALSVAFLSLGLAALTWLQSHTLSETSGREFANLGGLVAGVILGGVLLRGLQNIVQNTVPGAEIQRRNTVPGTFWKSRNET